jgi:hypothetical protein
MKGSGQRGPHDSKRQNDGAYRMRLVAVAAAPRAQSGRRRGHPRRPPTPPDIRITYPAVTASRIRVELASRKLFARWSMDVATALRASGPFCSVANSLAGHLSRFNGEIAPFPLVAVSALHCLVRATTTASADSHRPIPTPLDASSTRQADGPPRVMRVTFMLMSVGFTS